MVIKGIQLHFFEHFYLLLLFMKPKAGRLK